MIISPYSFLSLVGIALFSLNLLLLPDNQVLLYDSKRIFLGVVVVFICLSAVLSKMFRERVVLRYLSLRPIIRIFLVLFIILSFFADALGVYAEKNILNYFYFIGLLIITLVFSLERPTNTHFKLLSVVTLFCFISVAVGYTVATLFGDGPSIFYILSYTNPRFMNQVQIWLLIPTIYIAIVSKNKTSYLFPILNFTTMFALDARGLAVSFIGGIILWSVIDKTNRTQILKVSIISFFAGLLVSAVFLTPLPSYLMHGEQTRSLLDIREGSSGRVRLWLHALEIYDFWGLGSYGAVCTSELFTRPHNSVIKVLLNWGVIPSFIYSTLCLVLFYQVVREENVRYRVIGVTLLSGLAYSLVSSVLDSPLSLLFACLFTGWFCGRNKINTSIGPNKVHHMLLIVIASVSVLSVTNRIYERVDNDFYRDNVGDVLSPQFWLGSNCPEQDAMKGR